MVCDLKAHASHRDYWSYAQVIQPRSGNVTWENPAKKFPRSRFPVIKPCVAHSSLLGQQRVTECNSHRAEWAFHKPPERRSEGVIFTRKKSCSCCTGSKRCLLREMKDLLLHSWQSVCWLLPQHKEKKQNPSPKLAPV